MIALPSYFQNRTPTILQDFSSLTGLTIAGQTEAVISTDYRGSGTGSLKITAGSGGPATVDFTLPNLTFGPLNPVSMLLQFFMPVNNFTSILVFLSTTSNFSAGTWTSGPATIYEGATDQALFRTGYNNVQINRATFINGTPTLLDSAANVFTTCRIRIEADDGPVYYLNLTTDIAGRPKAMMGLDDNHGSLMAVDAGTWGVGQSPFSYMNARGIKGTLAINVNTVGTPGYMTVAELEQAYNAGWDLINHTSDHTPLTTVSEAVARQKIEECDRFMAQNGWDRGRKYFAYPTGEFYVNRSPAFIKSLGFYAARSISATILNNTYQINNLYNLWSMGVTPAVSSATVIAKLDEAITTGRTFGTYWHELNVAEANNNQWSPVKAKAVVDALYSRMQQGLIDSCTLSEWVTGLYKQRPLRS